jgi:Domain of unknown function (DUF6456)
MTTHLEQTRLSRRLLALLNLPYAVGRLEKDTVIVSVSNKGISLSKGCVPAIAAEILIERNLAEWRETTEKSPILVLKPVSNSNNRVNQSISECVEQEFAPMPDKFRSQHVGLTTREVLIEKRKVKVHFNDAESPLLWMRRRKGRDGLPMINNEAFIAGEKLRQDYTLANMTPRVTANWSNPTRGARGAGAPMEHFSDTMLAARQRVDNALSDCGPEFSGVLLDLCCFLKGLEQIETEHGWPVRSGKVVVILALSRLARHYGLSYERRNLKISTNQLNV